MIKLLRTRLPFACLLLALAAVWLGDLLSSHGKVVPRKPGDLDPARLSETIEIPAVFELSSSSALHEWIALQVTNRSGFREDPFAYVEDQPGPVLPGAATATATTSIPQFPVVQAISFGRGKSLAVIDRRIVGEGDTIGTWTVDRIEIDKVRISGPQGSNELRLARNPSTPPKPPASKSGSKTSNARSSPSKRTTSSPR